MSNHSQEEIRSAVRSRYGAIAQRVRVAVPNDGGSAEPRACGCASDCCGTSTNADEAQISTVLGYSAQELASIPAGADLGLGCGNPGAIASITPGEVVLDLGSGGGIDCFLAARATGVDGSVIGVDMTAEMISRARKNAERGGFRNVEFRLGEIEHLPVADDSVDVIISNCVINLSPDKAQVFRDAFRVLRSGGRLAVSDMVAVAPIPEAIQADLDNDSGCVAGASSVDDLQAMLTAAGFEAIEISPKDESRAFVKEWQQGIGVENYALSATITARKP